MKIVFMGTPEMAVPTLKKIVATGHDVPLVFTQPDKPKGRGKKMAMSAVKEAALELGIEVYQPTTLKNNEEALEKLQTVAPDFLVVVAYGRILPKAVLDAPKYAPINVHFSLLPKYRGAAPVNWAIVNGERQSGVATMFMDVGLDTGDILKMTAVDIDRMDAATLGEKLSHIGADLLIETIEEFDSITPQKQNESEATHAPIMKKDDGLIDWNMSAEEIDRRIRGFSPWPAAYTRLDGKMVKLFTVDVIDAPDSLKPGQVFDITRKSFSVKAGTGGLRVKELQFEGKKRMPTASFLAGAELSDDTIFG